MYRFALGHRHEVSASVMQATMLPPPKVNKYLTFILLGIISYVGKKYKSIICDGSLHAGAELAKCPPVPQPTTSRKSVVEN